MTQLSLHGRKVETVFHLIGNNENAITKGLGWCLSQTPSFLDYLGSALGTPELSAHNAVVKMQERQTGTGITDIEIYAYGYAAWIIEAKIGFTVPSERQLQQYARRLKQVHDYDPKARLGLVVLAASDRNNQWLLQQLPNQIDNIPITALSWRDIQRLANQAKNNIKQKNKRLLREFHSYLDSELSMQNQDSNWVYVVSLNCKTFGGTTRFLDVVKTHQKYFHPIGGGRGGWPSEPPNYLAFRYDGCLQSIHHVERYTLVNNLGPYFPDQPDRERDEGMLILYDLGPPIRPLRRTRVGKNMRATRFWCFIDTLLICDTVVAAIEATNDRKRRQAIRD